MIRTAGRGMRKATRRWVTAGGAVALVGLTLGPALGPERTLIYRDAIPYQAPQNRLLRDALTGLRLPEWDPSSYAGVPHLASPPAQALYPPRALAVLASGHPASPTDYGAALHLLLLAGGAWVLGRQLGLRAAARATLALTLLLAGPTCSALGNQPALAGIAWLPWALAAGLWARRGSLWRTGAVGLAIAAPVYAG
ncbi:MAG: hypothetical protein KDD82_27865, partial [Planctomycetes bacterium]|nr:hypothetical protein [Planctomycetota bacterium]